MQLEIISASEFARRVGITVHWCGELVKRGIIPKTGKKIEYNGAKAAYDSWQKTHGRSKQGMTVGPHTSADGYQNQTTGGERKTLTPLAELPIIQPDDNREPGDKVSIIDINVAYSKAKASEKIYQAKLRQLDYEAAKNNQVVRSDVENDATRVGAALRERFASIAPRISTMCEGKPAREIERIIETAINEALTALHKSRFGAVTDMRKHKS